MESAQLQEKRGDVSAERRWISTKKLSELIPRGTRWLLLRSGEVQQSSKRGVFTSPGVVSPNGKWLLYNFGGGDETIFLSMTSSRIVRRTSALPRKLWQKSPSSPDYPWSGGCWLADSDRWVRVYRGYYGLVAVVRRLSNPAYVQTVSLGLPPGTRNWDEPQCEVLGATKNEAVVALGNYGVECANLLTFGTKPAGNGGVRNHFIQFSHQEPFRAALSPPRDCIAWLVYKSGYGAGQIVPLKDVFVVMSDAEGRNLRQLASLEKLSPVGFHLHTGGDDGRPSDLTWSRDGRSVQFNFRRRIWTLKVPPRATSI